MEWRIRVYRPGDEMAVAQLAESCFDEALRPYYEEDGCRLFFAYIAPGEIAARQSHGAQLFLAETPEGRLAGMLEMRNFSHISMLFTGKEFRRMGVARSLIDRVTPLALRMHGAEFGGLTLLAVPGAVPVYRKLGFREEGPEQMACGVRFVPMRQCGSGLKREPGGI